MMGNGKYQQYSQKAATNVMVQRRKGGSHVGGLFRNTNSSFFGEYLL